MCKGPEALTEHATGKYRKFCVSEACGITLEVVGGVVIALKGVQYESHGTISYLF